MNLCDSINVYYTCYIRHCHISYQFYIQQNTIFFSTFFFLPKELHNQCNTFLYNNSNVYFNRFLFVCVLLYVCVCVSTYIVNPTFIFDIKIHKNFFSEKKEKIMIKYKDIRYLVRVKVLYFTMIYKKNSIDQISKKTMLVINGLLICYDG